MCPAQFDLQLFYIYNFRLRCYALMQEQCHIFARVCMCVCLSGVAQLTTITALSHAKEHDPRLLSTTHKRANENAPLQETPIQAYMYILIGHMETRK